MKQGHQRQITMRKSTIIIAIVGLIILGGLYLKLKFNDGKDRINRATIEANELTDNCEIRNGDLNFQSI
jgi:hypothetical protein